MRRHAPERQLVFTVDAHTELDLLRQHPGVLDLAEHRINGSVRVTLSTSDADALLGLVTTGLGGRGIQVRDVGLDGVFLRLTGSDFSTHDDPVKEA
ncbi:hypothetical protein [Nonomuraea helvata]|uniref:hypothetical protein n=1 Tax=Nonomuraea helvata TaxID=37484 RepID=UPI0031F156FF